jgi:hypothetical protein
MEKIPSPVKGNDNSPLQMPQGIESPISTNTFGMNLNEVQNDRDRTNSPYSQLPHIPSPENSDYKFGVEKVQDGDDELFQL